MLTACAVPAIEGFTTDDVSVSEQTITVAVAETPAQRAQGLQGLDGMPRGLDGMLFVYSDADDRSFHMRTVGFDLDIWWFDSDAVLVGSTLMEECLDGGCVSYPSPEPVQWALETPAGEFSFETGSVLSVPTVENP